LPSFFFEKFGKQKVTKSIFPQISPFQPLFLRQKKTPPHGGAFPENLGTVLVAIGDGLVIPKMKEFLGRISPVVIGLGEC